VKPPERHFGTADLLDNALTVLAESGVGGGRCSTTSEPLDRLPKQPPRPSRRCSAPLSALPPGRPSTHPAMRAWSTARWWSSRSRDDGRGFRGDAPFGVGRLCARSPIRVVLPSPAFPGACPRSPQRVHSQFTGKLKGSHGRRAETHIVAKMIEASLGRRVAAPPPVPGREPGRLRARAHPRRRGHRFAARTQRPRVLPPPESMSLLRPPPRLCHLGCAEPAQNDPSQ
jgi:hypothetical protein